MPSWLVWFGNALFMLFWDHPFKMAVFLEGAKFANGRRVGVKNREKFADVLSGWSLIQCLCVKNQLPVSFLSLHTYFINSKTREKGKRPMILYDAYSIEVVYSVNRII